MIAIFLIFGAGIALTVLIAMKESKLIKELRHCTRYLGHRPRSLADRTVAGVFALIFLIGILGITGMVAYRYMLYGEPDALEGIKTIWAVLGTPLGAILMYYFKS